MSENQTIETFGHSAIAALEKHSQKMIKHEAGVYEDQDPEALHQMRVGMRRLRTALVGFSRATEVPKAAREKKVGKIARELGTLRDLDVLKASLENDYLSSLPASEQKDLKSIFKELGRQRQHAYKKVIKALESKDYQNLKASLKQWLEKPKLSAIAPLPITEVLPDLLLPHVSNLLLHPGWFVGQNSDLDPATLLDQQGETLHSLRKAAKKCRYQMELFTHCYDEPYQQYVKEVKAIQSVLGDIHDSVVLGEFLSDCCGEAFSLDFPRLAQELTAFRQEKWQEWEQLQQYFLNPATRNNLRLTVQNPSLGEQTEPTLNSVAMN
ncbi:MAG: CHAD domain-containing protein [Halothece sp. Uz-M2-17]|nr:CHAD domain-containing protein [Halothece sp. Uz-M2-17]